jgi:hypothetical protein
VLARQLQVEFPFLDKSRLEQAAQKCQALERFWFVFSSQNWAVTVGF